MKVCLLRIVRFFDTTHEDNSVFSFEIGEETVIKAWDIAVRTMKVNKKF
jgi:peptidylprolyl isomerase